MSWLDGRAMLARSALTAMTSGCDGVGRLHSVAASSGGEEAALLTEAVGEEAAVAVCGCGVSAAITVSPSTSVEGKDGRPVRLRDAAFPLLAGSEAEWTEALRGRGAVRVTAG